MQINLGKFLELLAQILANGSPLQIYTKILSGQQVNLITVRSSIQVKIRLQVIPGQNLKWSDLIFSGQPDLIPSYKIYSE